MRRSLLLFAFVLAVLCVPGQTWAQRHTGGSSPPTAPPPPRPQGPTQPVAPVSSGLGALQFVSVNYGVPAPQSLTRQLQSDDDRTRAASLSAIGAPSQYLSHGHIPYPRSVDLSFVALGNTDELDALLTVELEQHIVSAVLLPMDGDWKRVATMTFPTAFYDPTTTPSTFLRTSRSLVQRERYRAIYRGLTAAPNGDYIENEAHLRIINNRAVITMSFVSSARICDNSNPVNKTKPGCEITQRWLQPDPVDPTRRFTLVTGTGRLNAREAVDPLAKSRTYLTAHVRVFACQPCIFSEGSQRYEATGLSAPCAVSR